MQLTLTWDLFVLVFFIVIMAYSLIIGRDNTLKVILGTYVAGFAADALGSLFGKYFAGSEAFVKILRVASLGTEEEAIIFVKVLIFAIFVVLFAVRGAFEVETIEDRSPFIRLILSFLYAGMSAGLMLSMIFVFVSGVPIVGGGAFETTGTALWGLYNQSDFIRGIVGNSYLWFSLPALSFLVHSLYSHKAK